ncbi:hypothetical protein GCM10022233_37330 [Streptomyces shaanxiensis]|uniref:Uncharacterized protein n=1 Tax=Streptomyces shaanxiensis TaxID=653357 RepID=A0ABP7V6D0_9ACTN
MRPPAARGGTKTGNRRRCGAICEVRRRSALPAARSGALRPLVGVALAHQTQPRPQPVQPREVVSLTQGSANRSNNTKAK